VTGVEGKGGTLDPHNVGNRFTPLCNTTISCCFSEEGRGKKLKLCIWLTHFSELTGCRYYVSKQKGQLYKVRFSEFCGYFAFRA